MIYDTFFMATRPLQLLTWYLMITVLLLAAWWLVARLSDVPPRRPLFAATLLLMTGFLLTAAPTIMLVTGVIWPSVYIVFQLGAVGVGVIGFVILVTAIAVLWRLTDWLIRRRQRR